MKPQNVILLQYIHRKKNIHENKDQYIASILFYAIYMCSNVLNCR